MGSDLLMTPDVDGVEACVATVHWIITSAAKHSVDEDSLNNELQVCHESDRYETLTSNSVTHSQQLGLPKGRLLVHAMLFPHPARRALDGAWQELQ